MGNERFYVRWVLCVGLGTLICEQLSANTIQLIPLMDDITVDILDNSKKSGPGLREAMTVDWS